MTDANSTLQNGGLAVKHRLFCFLAALMLLALPAAAEAQVMTPELFRLQVVAESDSEEDQQRKLDVRDAVLRLCETLFADVQSADEAYRLTQAELDQFRNAAKSAAGGAPVRIEVGSFDFPDRIYGGVRVPAGTYRALRIVIGSGEGHNWWCVLYPTLCCFDENLVGNEGSITFYSHTLRFLERLFGGEKV